MTKGLKAIIVVFILGVFIYLLEGCATPTQHLCEACEMEVYRNPQVCWDSEDLLECTKKQYRDCEGRQRLCR